MIKKTIIAAGLASAALCTASAGASAETLEICKGYPFTADCVAVPADTPNVYATVCGVVPTTQMPPIFACLPNPYGNLIASVALPTGDSVFLRARP
jgi:hypothetical protein